VEAEFERSEARVGRLSQFAQPRLPRERVGPDEFRGTLPFSTAKSIPGDPTVRRMELTLSTSEAESAGLRFLSR